MSSISERSTIDQTRTYDRWSSVVFLKTNEPFGGLSNMAGGFPLHVQGIRIYTSEALYQACRFPHLPEVQRLIIGQASPMTAKMKSKPYRKDSRPDWDRVRVKVMRWCLRVKLAQSWVKFSELLLRTGNQPIVEESRRDDFWGAKPVDEKTLVGMNVLGRLLMELREAVKSKGQAALLTVEPPDIPEFLLLGRPIGTVADPVHMSPSPAAPSTAIALDGGRTELPAEQCSLFDTPAAREVPAPEYITSSLPTSTPLSDLKPYPAMKDSGVPWLGEVPEHWEVRRLKYLLRERDVRSSAGAEQLLRVSQFTGVTERKRADGDDNPDTRAESLVGYKLVEPEDLVVNIMLAWNGSMGVSRFSGIASPAYCVYRFIASVQPWYFHHLLRAPAYKARIKAVSTGVVESRLRLYSDDLYRLDGLLPPREEQLTIVRFLDHTDRRIRRYIRAKQKLITLLEEQKQVIIHRAVTRGLDPNVRLKPSGVEWLGDVPEHWEVASLRHRYSQVLGKMLDSKRITGESLLPYLRNTDVQWDRINVDGLPQMDITPAEYERYTVRAGDLLVCEGGEVGRAAIWTGPLLLCGFQKALHRLRPINPESDVPRFLYFALRAAAKGNAFSDGHVSTIAHLTGEKLRGHPFPFPPRDEQHAIAQFLDVALFSIGSAIGGAARQIEHLREYRTRLIADVVTGKLDVREAAARLPDEIDDPELLDEGDAGIEAEEATADSLDTVLDAVET